MKKLTVIEYPKQNQWCWAWIDEFTKKYEKCYQIKEEALQNRPENSIGTYYNYNIITK